MPVKKLFVNQTLESGNGYTLYSVKVDNNTELFKMKSWCRNNCVDSFVFGENIRKEWDYGDEQHNGNMFITMFMQKIVITCIIGFKSKKDALMFCMVYKRFEEVKVWPSDTMFTITEIS